MSNQIHHCFKEEEKGKEENMEENNQYAWILSQELIKKSTFTAFLIFCGLSDYEDLSRKSDQDLGWLRDSAIRYAGLQFYQP
jgi:hypothetical protein